MPQAIIGGTGFDQLSDVALEQMTVETPYGDVPLYVGRGEAAGLIFLPRHGPEHQMPPHSINYRANLMALHQLEVDRALATFAVGSLHREIPPGALVVVDQFLDFTQGRAGTFFDGEESGVVHTVMDRPYCPALREQLLAQAAANGLEVIPRGAYACTDGPRFETPAEVRMLAQLGGDVVGMTGVPEAPLARELGIHYAAVAISINWGAGLEKELTIVRGLEAKRKAIIKLFIDVLRQPSVKETKETEAEACPCEAAPFVSYPPQQPWLSAISAISAISADEANEADG